ncbi:MAG: hypothetical protein E7361_01815 [Clostridiales bacterium]|nr:hypothetical protein [Clostridiales bacterium]
MGYTFYNYNKNKEITLEEENEYSITNERLKDAIIVNSSLGTKLMIKDFKKDKDYLIKMGTVIRSNFGHYIGKCSLQKVYYDTDDMYFHNVGINICEIIESNSKQKEIVVRYDSKRERISYLKFQPDTYLLKVPKKDKISKYYNFIESAILQLITNGLQTNVMDLLKTLKPLINVSKKREHWRFTLPSKLIVNCNFDNCIYTTPKCKDKYKTDILEIMAENEPNEYSETYEEFIKELILDLPTLIKTKHSDLFIGLDYLLNIRQ